MKKLHVRTLVAIFDWLIFFLKLAWAIYVSIQVSSYYNELEAVRFSISSVNSDASALRVQLDSLSSVYNFTVAEFRGEFTSVQSQIASLQTQIANNSLIALIQQATSEFQKLANGTHVLQIQVKEITTEYSQLAVQVGAMKGTVVSLAAQTMVEELSLMQQQAALAAFNFSLTQQVQQSVVQLVDLATSATSLQQQVTDLGNNIVLRWLPMN
jgi:hypothetical protein